MPVMSTGLRLARGVNGGGCNRQGQPRNQDFACLDNLGLVVRSEEVGLGSPCTVRAKDGTFNSGPHCKENPVFPFECRRFFHVDHLVLDLIRWVPLFAMPTDVDARQN